MVSDGGDETTATNSNKHTNGDICIIKDERSNSQMTHIGTHGIRQ